MINRVVALKHSAENIGDDIQRIGLASVLPESTVWIDRNDYNALMALQPEDKLIVSGWFNREQHHWYGNIKAKCLYIGFHCNERIETNAVIGCRGTHTLGLYENAWLSYCTSMLLPTSISKKNKNVVFCGVPDDARIPNKISRCAITTTHCSDEIGLLAEECRDIEAKRLLGIYAEAGLVITSKLHCLLPCLVYGTPVVFYDGCVLETERICGYENLYWTLENCPWHLWWTNKDNSWKCIPPKVSSERILGMIQGMRASIQKFIKL